MTPSAKERSSRKSASYSAALKHSHTLAAKLCALLLLIAFSVAAIEDNTKESAEIVTARMMERAITTSTREKPLFLRFLLMLVHPHNFAASDT